MRFTILLLFASLTMRSFAQDSTAIKLDRYKQLFISGTITSQEYETMRKQALGIKREAKVSKEAAESFQLKHGKHKRAGMGMLVSGGVSLLFGSGLAASSAIANNSSASALFYSGIACYGLSVGLFIGGGIEIHRYIKYKRQWKDSGAEIVFAPTSISLTF